LGEAFPELSDGLLLCATETKTAEDIALLAKQLREVLRDGAVSEGLLINIQEKTNG
jgi:hypothetical protein